MWCVHQSDPFRNTQFINRESFPSITIGVPIGTKYVGGADALYSTVQMPRGVPVATVAIDGAVNAAILAAQILASTEEDLRKRLREFKESFAEGLKL